MTCSGGFRTWKPPGLPLQSGHSVLQTNLRKPPFFNGGLPFIVWKPACRRLPWRSKMIKVPLTVVGAEQLKAELQHNKRQAAVEKRRLAKVRL
jgi:hypothetical protein